jgi:hypothetical protein
MMLRRGASRNCKNVRSEIFERANLLEGEKRAAKAVREAFRTSIREALEKPSAKGASP